MDLITILLATLTIMFVLLLALACLAAWIVTMFLARCAECAELRKQNADLEKRLLTYEEVG